MSVETRRWSRREYDRLVELGILHEDEHIELIGGHMIVSEKKTPPHAAAIGLVAEALRVAFGGGWLVCQQDPVALDDDSEPEPDVFVVPGEPRDYLAQHPSQPLLTIEIAEASLAFDRRHKGSVYARAGLPEYWIANLVDRRLEVYRHPAPAASAEFGWRYLDVQVFSAGATVSPLARPDIALAVTDLLP